MKYLITFLVSFAVLSFQSSSAHSGRTNAQGCHNDNVNGGYHCHNSGSSSRSSTSSPSRSSNNSSASECHPNYSGCLRVGAGDYDCAGGTGNGPNYTGRVRVKGRDVFGLDRDGDGWGCE